MSATDASTRSCRRRRRGRSVHPGLGSLRRPGRGDERRAVARTDAVPRVECVGGVRPRRARRGTGDRDDRRSRTGRPTARWTSASSARTRCPPGGARRCAPSRRCASPTSTRSSSTRWDGSRCGGWWASGSPTTWSTHGTCRWCGATRCDLDPEIASWCLDFWLPLADQLAGSAYFGPMTEPADDTPGARLLALLGRSA